MNKDTIAAIEKFKKVKAEFTVNNPMKTANAYEVIIEALIKATPNTVTVEDIFAKIFSNPHNISSAQDYFIHAAKHYPNGLIINPNKKATEMNKRAHTPTPWTYDHNEYTPERIFVGTRLIAHVAGDSAETQANAAYIVKAVNSHAALVDAASLLMARLSEFGDIDRIRDEAPIQDLRDALAAAKE